MPIPQANQASQLLERKKSVGNLARSDFVSKIFQTNSSLSSRTNWYILSYPVESNSRHPTKVTPFPSGFVTIVGLAKTQGAGSFGPEKNFLKENILLEIHLFFNFFKTFNPTIVRIRIPNLCGIRCS